MNVADLDLERDIVPVFDNGLNENSKKLLIGFFEQPPATLHEVLDRQEIMKAFCQQQMSSLSSYRLDIQEVFLFTESISGDYGLLLKKNSTSIRLTLLGDRKLRDRLVSKAIQVAFVLNKIYAHYFKNLRTQEFPSSFKPTLNILITSLELFAGCYDDDEFLSGNAGVSKYIQSLREINTRAEKGEIKAFWNAFFIYDVYVSISCTLKKRNFAWPVFAERGLSMSNIYHPLVKNPVKNNVETEANIIILTGPNMSGKSTLLKSLSICLYLGHLGLAVPADACTMPFFKELNVHLNSRDDLRSGLSHFMAEIVGLKNVIEQASHNIAVYAAWDEMFSGTDIDDAYELFKTTITGLKKFKHSFFVISTHLNQLRDYIMRTENTIACYYLETTVDNENPVFTFKLKSGWSDDRLGQILFEKIGLRTLLE